MSASNTVFSILSFFSFILAIIPFSWQAEAWNTGVCLYMAWTAVQSLNVFINSVLWRNNAINWSPVWCDISTRIYIGTNVAIPLASFCINRTLNQIITRPLSISKDAKKRRLLIDLAIGLGLPILEIVLSYIVQGHRFDILEEIGCWPAIYNTPPTFALVYCWPLVISTLTSVYSVLTVRALLKSRSKTLGQYTVLSRHRLSRLLALASLEAIVSLPVSAYFLSINADEINPWVSWSDTHFNFSRVGQIPSLLWRSDSRAVLAIELSRWNIIICSFLFFAFFGLAEEAIARYRDAFRYILSRLERIAGLRLISPSQGRGQSHANDPQDSAGPIIHIRHTDEEKAIRTIYLGPMDTVALGKDVEESDQPQIL